MFPFSDVMVNKGSKIRRIMVKNIFFPVISAMIYFNTGIAGKINIDAAFSTVSDQEVEYSVFGDYLFIEYS